LLVLSLSDDAPPSTPVSPSTACNATTDPTFCRTVLPPHGTSDLYTYGRFSVAMSLASANKFVGLVDRYLSRHRHLSRSAVGALQDCKLLAGFNVDFLSATGAALKSTETLLDPQADDVHTLLSAILTNQETCLDGLQAASGAWSDRGGGLASPIANGTKLYSLSLSLFTRAWVPTAKAPRIPRKTPHHGHKKPPAAAAHARRGLFDASDEEMVRRMAIEGPQGTVAVNRAVTVDQGGAGVELRERTRKWCAAAPEERIRTRGFVGSRCTGYIFVPIVTRTCTMFQARKGSSTAAARRDYRQCR
jgi:pectinesterase